MNVPSDLPKGMMPGRPYRPIYYRWWFWVIAVPLLLYIALVIYRIPAVAEKERTQEAVARIHTQKLTLDDVDGKHLPPPPDPSQVDATIEGIDANQNGIRDDVELAIFKKYPYSARIRAAELQYAKALQLEFTEIFNSETLINAINEEGRGYLCIANDARTKEVENLVVNTNTRTQYREDIRRKYMASFGLASTDECDIDLNSLTN